MELIAYQSRQFLNQSTNYVEHSLWKGLYKLLGDINIGLNDRTNTFKFPIVTTVPENFEIPNFRNSILSYKECALSRAQEILNRQETVDKPIYLMYSGGIDSSVVLTSFMELLGVDSAAKRINILMNQESIDENPEMWYNYIRPNFNVISSDFSYNDKDIEKMIYVSGELNDQLFGADIQQSYELFFGAKSLLMPVSYDLLYKFISECKGLDEIESKFWTEILILNLNSCPKIDRNMGDVFWWYNFTWKWIYVYYRVFLFSRLGNHVDKDWIQNDYFPFFGTNEFQLWSLYSDELKHQGTWGTYKYTAKKYVCDFLKSDFYMNKVKRQSLKNIVYLRKRYGSLDSNLTIHKNLPIENVYQEDNLIRNYLNTRN